MSIDYIFIEPNELDKWSISWKMARNTVPRNDLIEILELVPIKKTNSRNGKYKLELKNKDGEIELNLEISITIGNINAVEQLIHQMITMEISIRRGSTQLVKTNKYP